MKNAIKTALAKTLRVHDKSFYQKPVFIVACGRSGSTAFCQALGMHPQILMSYPEGPLCESIGKVAQLYANDPASKYIQSSVQLDEFQLRTRLQDLIYTSVFAQHMGLTYNPIYLFKKNSAFTCSQHLEHWGSKIFPDESAAEGLSWLFPDAKYIYLFRNGLDVIHSMSKFSAFAKRTFENRCRYWADKAKVYNYLRTHPEAIVIPFEEFLNDSATVFENVFLHLGIKQDEAPTQFAHHTHVHPLDQTTLQANPKEAITKRRKGYLDWDQNQKETFKSICGPAMELLGYDIPF